MTYLRLFLCVITSKLCSFKNMAVLLADLLEYLLLQDVGQKWDQA